MSARFARNRAKSREFIARWGSKGVRVGKQDLSASDLEFVRLKISFNTATKHVRF